MTRMKTPALPAGAWRWQNGQWAWIVGNWIFAAQAMNR